MCELDILGATNTTEATRAPRKRASLFFRPFYGSPFILLIFLIFKSFCGKKRIKLRSRSLKRMPFSHHSHSGQFCLHAQDTLEQMIQAAIAKGMIVFSLTEHMPRDCVEDLYPEEVGSLSFYYYYSRLQSFTFSCIWEKKKAQKITRISFIIPRI